MSGRGAVRPAAEAAPAAWAAWRAEFARFRAASGDRLHFAAHSHHWWPDVTMAAHERAWLDACEKVDAKWERVFGELLPRAQAHVARHLGLPDPATVAFAPNTHELVTRIVSCLRPPVRIVSTDAEFHSFARQSRRWEEAGLARVERVPVEPFATFADRFRAAATAAGVDLVYVSHVFFDSGFVYDGWRELATVLPPGAPFLVVDGYHAFMALPAELGPAVDRAFWLGGGYKYAMAGEGACFVHAPPGFGPRPVDTGWFAGFDDLAGAGGGGKVGYPSDGARFLGSTFDPTPLHRFVASLDLWERLGATPAAIHARVGALQARFLDGLAAAGSPRVRLADLVPGRDAPDRGHFLTFRTRDAAAVHDALRAADVVTDFRRDRLRFGFGLYHDEADVDALVARVSALRPA